jgi:putative addiction module component (TIGR02574 family)
MANPGHLDRGAIGDQLSSMSTKQLTAEAMALPIAEKVSLAQALWQSIDAGVPDSDERAAVREAVRRDKELSAGTVVGLSHEEAMKAARRAIGCK